MLLKLSLFAFLLALSLAINKPYHKSPRISSSLPQIPLTVKGYEMIMSVTLGTPGQHFNVFINFDNTDTMVPSKECRLSVACTGHNTFDSAKSSTYNSTGQKFNFSGLTGYVGSDVIGGLGVQPERIVFGHVTMYESIYRPGPYDDGFIGLGNVQGSFKGKNFVQVLYENNQIPSPSFSIYLSKINLTNKLILGGINPTYNSTPFTYHPVMPGDLFSWAIPMSEIIFNGTNYSTPYTTVIDDTSEVIIGPSKVIDLILAGFGGKGSKQVKVDCDKIRTYPNLTIRIEQVNYQLKPEEYILKQDNVCTVRLISIDLPASRFILGIPFLRAFYTHFDLNQKIGFARTKQL